MAGTLAGLSCLVLGAGGFIGSHLCHALAAAGATVHGFGRRPAFPDSLPVLRFTAGEFNDRAALALAIDGADVVFHLLGGTNPAVSNNDPIADVETNTLASIKLLELCRASSVRKVVFVSSGGAVYGVPRSVPIPEDAPTWPISAYGINKLMVEKYLQLYRHLHGVRSVSLRVSNPFGPYQSPFRRQGVVPALIERHLAGHSMEVWGDGTVVRDFIYVADVAEALVAAAAYQGPEQVLNIGSGRGRSIREVVADIGLALGTGEPDVLFRPGRASDVPANVLDIGRARAALAWAPRTDWMTGLRQTAAWISQAFPKGLP